jgi:NADH-quinone oxidoreductase subunit L
MEINLNDVNYLPWLIPAGPLLAFFIITLITNRSKLIPATSHEYGGHHPDYEGMLVPVVSEVGRVASVVVGMIAALIALVLSLTAVGQALSAEHFGEEVFQSSAVWMDTGRTTFNLGVLVDPFTAAMLVMVPITVLAIFIYSIGYMAHDPRQARFFALISLFAGAMLTLVVADNLLLLFVGWEVMGLCSYMLIGFWFEKESAYKAAIKAFMTTRVADVIMLLGIAYLYFTAGTLSFREILYNPEVLEKLATTPAIIFGGSAAALIGVFLIIGTIGKSAQFPLHVWLPDAMEGPTPVSAMIHAATMVSAGVYMVARMFPLLSAGWHEGAALTPAMTAMAVIGSFTALFAATIAVAQNDIKRVLAYSTISQLGYMVAALGIGAFVAAVFHLVTHAFFKALLFLGSGSVIHGMEHGVLHTGDHKVDPQDMWNMGGLASKMPTTFWTFLVGGLALSGFPLITAGFWSKDEILADAWGNGHVVVFGVLALSALLTAFYTMRQITLTFLGKPRTKEAEHAHETPLTMTGPLMVLAVFAIAAGWAGIPEHFPVIGGILPNWFHDFVGGTLLEHPHAVEFSIIPLATSVGVALGGLLLGYLVYKDAQTDPLKKLLGPVHTWLEKKYYFDELYDWAFVRPARRIAHDFAYMFVDRNLIDGFLHAVAEISYWLGGLFREKFDRPVVNGFGDWVADTAQWFGNAVRKVQTGGIQQYMLLSMLLAFIGVFFYLWVLQP